MAAKSLPVRVIVKVVLVLAVLLFALWVWPTLYRYDSLRGIPIRTNRFTGQAQRLTLKGWETISLPPLPEGATLDRK